MKPHVCVSRLVCERNTKLPDAPSAAWGPLVEVPGPWLGDWLAGWGPLAP